MPLPVTNTLPETTPIYKYMSVASFLHFFTNQSLVLQSIRNWPDAAEGGRFEFLKMHGLIRSDSEPKDYLGTCWTLQNDDQRLFDSDTAFQKSCEEIKELGSAAMWEAYCRGGGVRVKTTIGKVLDVLRSYKDLWHGKVYYEPSSFNSHKQMAIEEALFYKRTCFRHEDEYRFIIRPDKPRPIDDVPIPDLRDFIDEMLVSPSKEEDSWISRAIYKTLAFSNVSSRRESLNSKEGKQYCRISRMYGLITHEL
jgi:hypothetical protein